MEPNKESYWFILHIYSMDVMYNSWSSKWCTTWWMNEDSNDLKLYHR